MKKAWIENNIIRDIAHAEPSEIYHSDIAIHYDTDVPDEAQNGWELVNGVWTAPVIPVIEPPAIDEKVLQAQDITEKLNTFARERDYDDIIDACSYISSTNTLWQLEAQIAIKLRDETWQAFYANTELPHLSWA